MTATAATEFDGPRSVPGVRLRADGAEVDPAQVAELSTLRVRREASAPAACALVFEDPADAVALESALSLGAEVEVRVDGFAAGLFTGEVVAIERTYRSDGTVTVEVRCHDAAHRLRADSRLRVFVDISVADLARDLAADVGLGFAAAAHTPTLPRLVQDGRSALELLTAATRRAGLWWRVDAAGDRLELFTGDGADEPPHELTLGTTMVEAVVTDTAFADRSAWRVQGWDPVTGETAAGEAEGRAAGPAAHDAVLGGAITAGGAHLEALARGLAADDRATGRTLRAVVEGDPALVPGARVAVRGLTPAASDDFVVLASEHIVDPVSGFTTTISTAPPDHLRLLRRAEPAGLRDASAITLAEVLRIDDPDARGRVRVALLAYDGLETEWLPVLALGAGDGKGLALQPGVGDRVLLAHDPGDPGRGVVLGGMRSSDGGEPGVGVVDGDVVVYGLRLPTGQAVRLASEADTVVISNDTGSRVELSETGIVIHAEGDLVVEAPGHLLRLQADRIEFERA